MTSAPPSSLEQRLAQVRRRIAEAERAYGREPGSVSLLAVSKQQGAAAIRAAFALGLRAFGENYVQEALGKVEALADLDCEWHFVGPLQSNKSRAVAEHFAWLHSLDREKLARRLDDQRPAHLPPLQVCLQVNISGEDSKSGVAPAEVPELARALAGLPRLRLRGLMALPAPSEDPAEQRRAFAAVRRLLEDLQRGGIEADTLSMGMTADLEAAIAEGATLVRIGTAIFGPRKGPTGG